MDVVQGHNKAPVISINPNTMETGVYTTKFPPVVLLIAPPPSPPLRLKHMSHADVWIQHFSMPLISPNRSSNSNTSRITTETIVGIPH